MKPTRRVFLGAAGGAAAAAPIERGGSPQLDSVAIARRHPLVRTQPTPEFFEGLLLGNGDIGVCVTVRPDALGIHIGKSDAWDIRVSEEHAAHIKTFQEVLELWKRAGEEAKRQGKPEMTFLESNIDFFREYSPADAVVVSQAVAASVAMRDGLAALGFAHGLAWCARNSTSPPACSP